MICRETFSSIYSLPSYCWEAGPLCAVISDFFWANFRLLSHPAQWSSASRLNVSDILKIYLVHQSLYFHVTSPLLTTTPYHLLRVLHIVRCASVGVIMNIKNSFKRKHIYSSVLYVSPRSRAQHCIISQMQPHFHLASNLALLKRLLLWICFLCHLAVYSFCLNAENLCKILTSICQTPVDLPFSLKFSSTLKWEKRKHFISY